MTYEELLSLEVGDQIVRISWSTLNSHVQRGTIFTCVDNDVHMNGGMIKFTYIMEGETRTINIGKVFCDKYAIHKKIGTEDDKFIKELFE